MYEDVTVEADMADGTADASTFNYYPSQMYICLGCDTTLVLKRSGMLFTD